MRSLSINVTEEELCMLQPPDRVILMIRNVSFITGKFAAAQRLQRMAPGWTNSVRFTWGAEIYLFTALSKCVWGSFKLSSIDIYASLKGDKAEGTWSGSFSSTINRDEENVELNLQSSIFLHGVLGKEQKLSSAHLCGIIKSLNSSIKILQKFRKIPDLKYFSMRLLQKGWVMENSLSLYFIVFFMSSLNITEGQSFIK